jgi:MshEN domain
MKPRIGEMLLSEGRISEASLTRALELQHQDSRGTRLGAILLKWDLLAEQDLLDTLSRYHRCPAAGRDTLAAADRKALALLSPEQAKRLDAVPYAFEDKAVRVAFVDPSNLAAVDEVKAITGRKVLPAVTSQVRLVQAQQRFYSRAVALDLWSVVQKLERKKNLKTPSSIAPAPVEMSAPGSDPDPRRHSAGVDTTSPSDLSAIAEPVEALAEPLEEYETVGVGHPQPETRRSAEASMEPDPYSDDCPLDKFVEDALTFFSKDSDLAAVLGTLEEPVEDLDPSTEQATDAHDSGAGHSGHDKTMSRPRSGSGPGLSY